MYQPSYGYDPLRHEGYVWDDDDHFLNDPLIRASDGWWRVWVDPQPGIVGAAGGAVVWNYWPLTRMSFWVDRHLWGADANGLVAARLTNVALHALNALLLGLVLRQLQIPGATLAAFLFAVHPVTVESVAWITERKAVLSTSLFLVALAGWLRFTATARARWYLFASAAFLLALMAKTSTVMFPVLLVLLHGYERRPWTRNAVLQLAPFFAMSLVAGVTSIVFERFFIGSQGELFAASAAERVATAGRITWFYLGKTILPLGLSFNYPRWEIDASALQSYLPAAAVVAVAAMLWRFRSGWARGWILALGCFLANLFPVLGCFDIYGMRYAQVADHWVYLACTSIVALEAALFASVPQGIARAAAGAVAALVLVGFAALTWQQSAAYVDRATLWQHTLERAPTSFVANNNLGTILLAEGRYDEALAHFRRAIEAEPTFPEAHVNAGNALDASGRTAEAIPHWTEAVTLDPRQSIALYNLSVAHLKANRFAEAEALALRALAVDPRDARALGALRYLYEQQGRAASIEPFEARAQAPARTDRVAGGRSIALAIWSAMGVALAGCVAVAALVVNRRSGSPRPRRRG